MRISGERVTLRPATMEERRDVYSWMAESDATRAMMGPPLYPEVPVDTWEEFVEDYGEGKRKEDKDSKR